LKTVRLDDLSETRISYLKDLRKRYGTMKKYADQRSAQQVYANLMFMGPQGVRAYKLLDPKMRSRIYATPTASKSGMTYSYYFMNHHPAPPTFGKPMVVKKAYIYATNLRQDYSGQEGYDAQVGRQASYVILF